MACRTTYLRLAGPWIVAQEVFDDALAHVGSDDDAEVLARLGLEAASASRNRGEYGKTRDREARARQRATQLGDDRLVATCPRERATIAWLSGEDERPDAFLAEALRISRAAGDEPGVADCLLEIGTVHYWNDEYEDAVSTLQAASKIYRELGHRRGYLRALKNLGNTWYLMDEYDVAESALLETADGASQEGDVLTRAQALTKLGSISRLRGRWDEAVERLAEAQKLAGDLGDGVLEAEVLIDLGGSLAGQGNPDDAGAAFERSLELYRSLDGEDLGLGFTLKEFAELRLDQGRLEDAQQLLDQADLLFTDRGETYGQLAVTNARGRLLLQMAQPTEAEAAYRFALGQARSIPSRC